MSEILGPWEPLSSWWVEHVGGVVRGFGYEPAGRPEPPLLPGQAVKPRVYVNVATYGAVSADPGSFYCADDAVLPRRANTITASKTTLTADGVDEVLLTGVPAGSCIRVQGAVTLPWTDVEGGEVVLVCGVPGKLQIRIESPPPWLAWGAQINAD